MSSALARLALAGGLGLVQIAVAQDFDTSTHTAASPENPARAAADAALAAHDHERALALLKPLVAANPHDPKLLYDLAATEDALDQTTAAEAGYRASLAADDSFLEPRVALGLLLARGGKLAESRVEFMAATAVRAGDPALRARAFRSLARIDRTARPADAEDELLAALKLSPETPDDTLLAAELAERSGEDGTPAAETAYRRVLRQHPDDPAATAGLAHLLVTDGHAAEAEPLLTAAHERAPDDAALSAQLASVYAARGEFAKALPLARKLHEAMPDDPASAHLLATLYVQLGDYAKAEPLLAPLATTRAADPELRSEYGDALMHLKRFADAETTLRGAVADAGRFRSPANFAEALGRLAFAASENDDPQGALQALTIRATVEPPTAALLFVGAISHDKLHHTKLAQAAYRDFLAASHGTLPDQEFEARHRLIALAPLK